MSIITNPTIDTVVETLHYNAKSTAHLCGDANNHVNKWSKHKPVRWNDPAPDINGELHWRGVASDTHSIWGMYIENVEASIPNAVLYVYDNLQGDYRYDKPYGNARQPFTPFRLSDFHGYNHDAKPIVIKNDHDNQTFYVDNTDVLGPVLRFYVEGSDNDNDVSFEAIHEAIHGISDDERIVLVASVFDTSDNLIGEYFHNSRILDTYAGELDEGYDGKDFRLADIQFDKSTYWQTQGGYYNIFLTLQTIKRNSNGVWTAGRVLALPLVDGDPWMKSVRFIISQYIRNIRTTQIYDYPKWLSIDKAVHITNQSGIRLAFDINSTNEPFTLNDTRYLKSRHVTRDGRVIEHRGQLISSTGDVLHSLTVPASKSQTDITTVYYDFGSMLQENFPTYYPPGVWQCEIYLVQPGSEDILVDNAYIRTT